MNVTPWFDGGACKPKRKGVYQLMGGSGQRIGYQYWDGESWGAWAETPQEAMRERFELCWMAADGFQNDNWRGLAKKP